MEKVIYVKEDEDGNITLSKEEFEKILTQKYNDGYWYGIKTLCNAFICEASKAKPYGNIGFDTKINWKI